MEPTSSRTREIIPWLILLSVAARFLMLKGNLWRLGEDVDDYLRLAENISIWRTFGTFDIPEAYRPPLYPLVLVPAYWIESFLNVPWGARFAVIAGLHLIMGAATVVFTYRAADRWGLGNWSILAAVLVAADPLLVHNSRLAMTESFAAFFVAASLNLLGTIDSNANWHRSLIAGVVLGLGMLCRTTLWSFTFLTILVSAAVRPIDRTTRWRQAGVVLCVAMAVQVPWVVRNWRCLGWPVLTTTHGGYTLLLGNNDVFYDEVLHQPLGSTWSKESLERWQQEVRMASALAGSANELAYDAYCYRRALATIRSRPADFLRSIVYRIVSFWRITPHATDEYSIRIRLACALFYLPELLLMVIGLADRRAWQWPLVLLPTALISFTLVHAVYWSDMRMRAPIMPAVALLAAVGVQRIARRLPRPHVISRQ